MRCRRRLSSVTGFAVAAAFALASPASLAQTMTPTSGTDLLQPSLDGNPIAPPRFRRPGEKAPPKTSQAPVPGKFTAPSRIGATPIYGSPTGFGAGDTGFNSSNEPRRPKTSRSPASGTELAAPVPETTFQPVPTFASPTPRAPPKPAAQKKPVPAEIHPAKASMRPGAALPPPQDQAPLSNPPPEVHPFPAANRPGAVVPIPPPSAFDASGTRLPPFDSSASTPPPGVPLPNTLPLGTTAQRPLPLAEGDPYAALGIRAGSFLVLPAVELSTAYDTNPGHVPGGASSPYFVVAPDLQVHSDWDRHAFNANITGSYTEYADSLVPSLNRPYLNSLIDGRIDVSRDTHVIVENRVIVSTDNPGSPNLTAGLAQLPINTTVGGTLGLIQTFNRLSVSIKGTFDRAMYDSSLLTDGEISSNGDRNLDQYAGILRVGYDLNPGLKPFVEVQEDQRIHDEQFDRSGLQRDSVGSSAKVGADVDLFGSLTGEFAAGYLDRAYKDATLPNISGFTADGALIWQATALTTAKLSAVSAANETILPGTSGAFSHDFNLQVDHALLRWLVGTVKAGYGIDNYVGSALVNNRYFVSGGLAYKMNRDMQIRGEVRQDWLKSTEPGFAYTATSFLLGLRLQR